MKKRIASLLLALVLAFSFCVPAMAASAEQKYTVEGTYADGYVTITGQLPADEYGMIRILDTKNDKKLMGAHEKVTVSTQAPLNVRINTGALVSENERYRILVNRMDGSLAADGWVKFDSTPPTEYTIAITAPSHGTVTTTPAGKAAAGTAVAITATADTGYTVDTVTVKDAAGAGVTVTDMKFTMPESNVTVTVTFKAAVPGTYTITFDANGGTLSGDATMTTGADGKLASLPAAPKRAGYTFNGWFTAASGGDEVTTSTVFDKDTTVYAHWTQDGGNTPSGGGGGGGTASNLTIEPTKNGKIAASPRNPKKGDTVTVTLTPNEGYLGVLEVKDKDGNIIPVTALGDNKYSFVMPAGKVTVSADFVELSKLFKDVNADDYFYDAVLWAVAKDITNGKTEDLFGPNDFCTRAQIVTFVWRYMGRPEVKEGTATTFTDVEAGSYYEEAVAWAFANGVVNGKSPTSFAPEDPCTRAQAVALLHRLKKLPADSGNNPFTDVAEGEYYYNAVVWAADKGITNGTSPTTFSPDDTCTRGHIVTLLYRSRTE